MVCAWLLEHLGLLSTSARAKDWQKNESRVPQMFNLCCAEAGENPAWCDLIPPIPAQVPVPPL